MQIIELTPEFFAEQKPPAINITKKFIMFNAAAIKKLALHVDDHFIIHIDGLKIMMSPSSNKGFKIHKAARCLQSSAPGLQEYLIKSFRLVPLENAPKVSTLVYEIGEFKEGANPLIYKDHHVKYKTPD